MVLGRLAWRFSFLAGPMESDLFVWRTDTMTTPNKITAANAGWTSQFRFAVYGLVPGVAEFYRWATSRYDRYPIYILRFVCSLLWGLLDVSIWTSNPTGRLEVLGFNQPEPSKSSATIVIY